jgi:hypothetical protein
MTTVAFPYKTSLTSHNEISSKDVTLTPGTK